MNQDKNNISNVFPDTFRGNIDSFLNAMATADADAVEREVELENVAKQVAKDYDMTFDEAVEVVQAAQLAEIQTVIDQLMKEGLVEVVDYNADGEPLYAQTAKGKRLAGKSASKR